MLCHSYAVFAVCSPGFRKSVQYNQNTMEKAVKKVKEIQANMGGTKILQPLKDIYKQPCIPNHPRQVTILCPNLG